MRLTGPQQGSVLIFVVLICAGLLVLGAFLGDFNRVDLKIAANQRDSLQAYYLAETGIEVALGILAGHNPFFSGSNELAFAGGSISLHIHTGEQSNGSSRVTITSTGKVGNIQEKITVQFLSFPAFPGGTDGAALGWYDAESGEILTGTHQKEGFVSLGHPNPTSPLILLYDSEDNSTLFAAEGVFFQSVPVSLLVENILEIRAETTVFQGSVLLLPPEGGLCFTHPGGGSARVYLRKDVLSASGDILLEAGVYEFPAAFFLSGSTSAQQAEAYKVLPLVPGTMTWTGGEL